jgi:Protein of unknown function (DUF2934)
MAKSAKRKTDDAVRTATDRSPKALTDGRAHATDRNMTRRAYDLDLTRDREHEHDVDDWVQAERELRASSTTA